MLIFTIIPITLVVLTSGAIACPTSQPISISAPKVLSTSSLPFKNATTYAKNATVPARTLELLLYAEPD